jgi:hypothetical protein
MSTESLMESIRGQAGIVESSELGEGMDLGEGRVVSVGKMRRGRMGLGQQAVDMVIDAARESHVFGTADISKARGRVKREALALANATKNYYSALTDAIEDITGHDDKF